MEIRYRKQNFQTSIKDFCSKVLRNLRHLEDQFEISPAQAHLFESVQIMNKLRAHHHRYTESHLEFGEIFERFSLYDLSKCLIKMFIQIISMVKWVLKSFLMMPQKPNRTSFDRSQSDENIKDSTDYYKDKENKKFIASELYKELDKVEIKNPQNSELQSKLKEMEEKFRNRQAGQPGSTILQVQKLLSKKGQKLEEFTEKITRNRVTSDFKNPSSFLINDKEEKIQTAVKRLFQIFDSYLEKKQKSRLQRMVDKECEVTLLIQEEKEEEKKHKEQDKKKIQELEKALQIEKKKFDSYEDKIKERFLEISQLKQTIETKDKFINKAKERFSKMMVCTSVQTDPEKQEEVKKISDESFIFTEKKLRLVSKNKGKFMRRRKNQRTSIESLKNYKGWSKNNFQEKKQSQHTEIRQSNFVENLTLKFAESKEEKKQETIQEKKQIQKEQIVQQQAQKQKTQINSQMKIGQILSIKKSFDLMIRPVRRQSTYSEERSQFALDKRFTGGKRVQFDRSIVNKNKVSVSVSQKTVDKNKQYTSRKNLPIQPKDGLALLGKKYTSVITSTEQVLQNSNKKRIKSVQPDDVILFKTTDAENLFFQMKKALDYEFLNYNTGSYRKRVQFFDLKKMCKNHLFLQFCKNRAASSTIDNRNQFDLLAEQLMKHLSTMKRSNRKNYDQIKNFLRFPHSMINLSADNVWKKFGKYENELTLIELRKILRRVTKLHRNCQKKDEYFCGHLYKFFDKIGIKIND